jgi:hypothetical protein
MIPELRRTPRQPRLSWAAFFAPPSPAVDATGLRIDFSRLFLQVVIIGLVAGALYWRAHAKAETAGGGPATRTRPSNCSSSQGAVPPLDASPTMATLFGPDGRLVPEARPFDQGSLLSVEADTWLPVWWPDADEDGVPWRPSQRIRVCEDALRACMKAGAPVALDAGANNSEVPRILAGLRLLRSSIAT